MAGEERGLRRGETGGCHGPPGSEENVQGERIGGGAAPREYGKRPAREREYTGQLQRSREQGEKAADCPWRQRLSDRAQEGAASDADEHREEHRAGRRRGPEDARDGLERDPEDEKTGEADELDVRVDLKMRRENGPGREGHPPDRPASHRHAERHSERQSREDEARKEISGRRGVSG